MRKLAWYFVFWYNRLVYYNIVGYLWVYEAQFWHICCLKRFSFYHSPSYFYSFLSVPPYGSYSFREIRLLSGLHK